MYAGPLGVAFMYLKLNEMSEDSKCKHIYLEQALHYIQAAEKAVQKPRFVFEIAKF